MCVVRCLCLEKRLLTDGKLARAVGIFALFGSLMVHEIVMHGQSVRLKVCMQAGECGQCLSESSDLFAVWRNE